MFETVAQAGIHDKLWRVFWWEGVGFGHRAFCSFVGWQIG